MAGFDEARWMRAAAVIFWIAVLALTVVTATAYAGNTFKYLVFSAVSNLLLWYGFRRNALFFDSFMAGFFWLGFWLKLSVRVAFLGGHFHEPTGGFNGSPAAFDQALTVCVVGFAGLILASYLRERFFFSYPRWISPAETAAGSRFYDRHRVRILQIFVATVVFVAASNFALGVYQRGMVARTVLPAGLGGIYTWLLLFGLASFSAVVLHFELLTRQTVSPAAGLVTLLESFMTNTSMLSRGMVLNFGALAYATLRGLRTYGARMSVRFIVLLLTGFILLFVSSVLLVNAWRATIAPPGPKWTERIAVDATPLFLDRWVGMEGVMAVSSYPHKGWRLWSDAWNEKPAQELSFYDRTLIKSPYAAVDTAKYNYISLPGIIAFCFYPGSLAFLFLCMLVVSALAAAIEISIFVMGGRNLILCALLAEVIASRCAHFGYAPTHTYLLVGALYLNLALVHGVNKLLARREPAMRQP
jgi:hypothetical protein